MNTQNTTEMTNTPLEASAHSAALECYDAKNFTTAVTEDGAIQYMPGGLHTITPTQGGRAVTVTVMVDADSAAAMEEERKALVANGKSPYFSITHENDVAAFRPTKFYWATKPDATGKLSEGVWADGEWTASGKAARDGKDFKFFSPTFHVSSLTDDPATVVCQPMAKPVMGSLVNDPAFDKISPLFAKHASTLEAGGRGSGRLDYPSAADAATVSDLSANLASRRAAAKNSPASHRAAEDAHTAAVLAHQQAGTLCDNDRTKMLHDGMADFHTEMSGFHAGYDDSDEGLTDAAPADERASASDASSEHATLMSVELFAQAHAEALQSCADLNAAMSHAPPAHLAALADIESESWRNIADWAERTGYHGASGTYRESQQLAETYGNVCREQTRLGGVR
jgi:hypothetical protein